MCERAVWWGEERGRQYQEEMYTSEKGARVRQESREFGKKAVGGAGRNLSREGLSLCARL